MKIFEHDKFYLREQLIKVAKEYQKVNNYEATAIFAMAALQIPWVESSILSEAYSEEYPHALLYWANGWMGKIPEAQYHIMKCLDYQRENSRYMEDTKYYFEYPANNIAGWLSFREQTFLYNSAKSVENVVELGSWKGKSAHALCSSGCKSVTAIDTWMGSEFEPQSHAEMRSGSIFETFKENLKEFKNLKIIQDDINNVVKTIPDKSIDMVFIDAGHSYNEVKNDILKWMPKTKMILCGHDYGVEWTGVKQAVDEIFGAPDNLFDTIWVKNLY